MRYDHTGSRSTAPADITVTSGAFSTAVPGAEQPAAAVTLTATRAHQRRSGESQGHSPQTTILAILLARISPEQYPGRRPSYTFTLCDEH